MELTGIKTLVFSLSATVYGEPQYLPIDESHPTNPTNPYGGTKLQIKEILRDLSNFDPEWWIICLRYFNPVGAHESGLIGETPNGVPNNLMPYIVRVASGELPHLNIFGDDYETRDGTGECDYIHVIDLAEGHMAAFSYVKTNSEFQIFNLGTEASTSVLELILTFEKASHQLIRREVAQRRAGDLPAYYAKVDKAANLLGWHAKHSIEEACASAWKLQLSQENILD